jgi:hypothetical protein
VSSRRKAATQAVHEQLSLEHQQWTETFKHSSARAGSSGKELKDFKAHSQGSGQLRTNNKSFD